MHQPLTAPNDSMAATTGRATLRKSTRRRKKSYREIDSDMDDDGMTSPPPKRIIPSRASHNRHTTYNEEDSVSSSVSSDEDIHTTINSIPSALQTKAMIPSKRKARKPASLEPNTFMSHKKTKLSQAPSTKSKGGALIRSSNMVQSSTSKSPWQTLEYQILLQIMKYAAYPLNASNSRDTDTVRWLLQTSALCSSLHQACIGALMFSPPLYPAHRAKWALDLLKASARDFGDMATPTPARAPGMLTMDYRTKVKSLEIEAKQVLVKKAGIQLEELLSHVPLLKHLRMYHTLDSLSRQFIWALAKHARKQGRWSYTKPVNLFHLLDKNGIVLETFEWNGRFLQDDPLLFHLQDVSLTSKSLSQLHSITLRNFNLPEVDSLKEQVSRSDLISLNDGAIHNNKQGRLIQWRIAILKALRASPRLQEVAVYDSNVLDDACLSDFPPHLRSLSLSNCDYITNDGIEKYLHGKGQNLTSLSLEGNRSMSLGFMSALKACTPYLQRLHVDLSYYDPTSYHDTEPLFDDLLPTGPPSWPVTMQYLSVGPLRKVDVEDAEKFFDSLVKAAPDLVDLRYLSLRAILTNASWRDRATLRRKWGAVLNSTFHINHNRAVQPPIPASRRKTLITASSSSSESEASTRGRKSKRIQQIVESDNVDSDEIDESGGTGRCHTVIFELSDQRPAQEQFKEGDFLDNDPDDDDGEWDNRDMIGPPTYSRRSHAW